MSSWRIALLVCGLSACDTQAVTTPITDDVSNDEEAEDDRVTEDESSQEDPDEEEPDQGLPDPDEDAPLPYDALRAAGLDQYLGKPVPEGTENPDDALAMEYVWSEDAGPLCRDGSVYRAATRDMGAEDLLIALEGGGLTSDAADIDLSQSTADTWGQAGGSLDHTDADNPFAAWNVVYVPYCDGALHSGDTEEQRGLQNLSAALDVAVQDFPNPQRVVITGSSAGGYGTPFATALARMVYPDAEILAVNDAGPLLGKPGEPEFIDLLANDFGMEGYLDAACAAVDCAPSDHLTWVWDYLFQEDPGLRMALISSKTDVVIRTYLGMGLQPGKYEDALLGEADFYERTYPGRFESFIYNGGNHTVMAWAAFQFIDIEDRTPAAWLDAMINAPEEWDSLRD
ncbi:MAG: pectin acetylesterase-family hydrolase [Myxococcota bacterium]